MHFLYLFPNYDAIDGHFDFCISRASAKGGQIPHFGGLAPLL